MVPRPRNGLSLCSGGGGLDLGLSLAEPGYHTRCYVELEEYPRQCLIAAQRAGYMAPAPIWDDLTTFDAKPFAGAFDTLIAGYPCQGESQAGKRLGKDDERWLWDDIARIIRELGDGLRWCFFENVRGHVTLGGETVLRKLSKMDFTVSAGIFSAEEVSASHERQRIFIVAYRNSDLAGAVEGQPDAGTDGGRHAGRGGGTTLDHPAISRCDDEGQRSGSEQQGRECLSGSECSQLADASQPGLQGREQRRSLEERHGPVASGSTAQLRGSFLFPPGPRDMDAWYEVIANAPHFAPSLSLRDVKGICDGYAALVEAGELEEAEAESWLRLLVDGLSNRSKRLRLMGNAVVPLQAAYAWRSIAAAHGLEPL